MLVCYGCPIADYTGKKFCKGSPYGPWLRHQIEAHDKLVKRVYCPECRRLAKDMHDFMIAIVEDLKAKAADEKRSGGEDGRPQP